MTEPQTTTQASSGSQGKAKAMWTRRAIRAPAADLLAYVHHC